MADLEEWRDLLGYEGIYQVSSLGRVKRLARIVAARSGGQRIWEEEITSGHMGPRGYLRVKLSGDGRARNEDVHRLICATFHGRKPAAEMHAAHGDGVKTNNRADNLRWATPKENAEDRLAHGGQVRGEQIATGKLTEGDVREIRGAYTKRYGIIREMALKYGVRSENIIAVVKGRSWKHLLEEAA